MRGGARGRRFLPGCLAGVLLFWWAAPGLAGPQAEAGNGTPAAGIPAPEVSVAPGAVAPAWRLVWERARQMARGGKREGAIALYVELLEKRPGLVEARWELAQLYAQAGRREAAIQELLRYVEDRPGAAKARLLLGDLLADMGQCRKALEHYLRALAPAEGPGGAAAPPAGAVDIEPRVARCLEHLGRREEALDHWRAALAARPEDPELRKAVGFLLARMGRGAEAVALLRPLVPVARDDPEFQRLYLKALLAAGRWEEARPLIAALRRDEAWKGSASRDLVLQVARLFLEGGEPLAALDLLETRLAAAPDDAEALRLYGAGCESLQWFSRAARAWRRVVDRGGRPADRVALARVLLRAERFRAAREVMDDEVRAALEADPEARRWLVAYDRAAGDGDAAWRSARRAFEAEAAADPAAAATVLALALERFDRDPEAPEAAAAAFARLAAERGGWRLLLSAAAERSGRRLAPRRLASLLETGLRARGAAWLLSAWGRAAPAAGEPPLDLGPGAPRMRLELAAARCRAGAAAELAEVGRLGGWFRERAALARAECLAAAGRYEAAMEALGEVLAGAPRHVAARRLRARVLASMGDDLGARAETAWLSLLAGRPEPPPTPIPVRAGGQVFAAPGEVLRGGAGAPSPDALFSAIRQDGISEGLLFLLGLSQEQAGARAEAAATYRGLVRRHPGLWPAWRRLLALLGAEGRGRERAAQRRRVLAALGAALRAPAPVE
ncbi:tetratricopeptide repeat protein, partial [Dissulfurirhabdus thermomarina]